jgi:hypothetical protein
LVRAQEEERAKPSIDKTLLGFFMALFVGWKLLKSAKKAPKSTKKDQMFANMYANLCE